MKDNPFDISAPAGCTNERIGRLLAAFEWGLLTSEEEERVEEHIIGCAACAAELNSMWAVGTAIRTSRKHHVGWKPIGAVAAAAALFLTIGLGMLDRYEKHVNPLMSDSLDSQSGQSMVTFSYELTTTEDEGFSFNLDIP